MAWRDEEFNLGGVNHLAMACSEMKRTVAAERTGVRV